MALFVDWGYWLQRPKKKRVGFFPSTVFPKTEKSTAFGVEWQAVMGLAFLLLGIYKWIGKIVLSGTSRDCPASPGI